MEDDSLAKKHVGGVKFFESGKPRSRSGVTNRETGDIPVCRQGPSTSFYTDGSPSTTTCAGAIDIFTSSLIAVVRSQKVFFQKRLV